MVENFGSFRLTAVDRLGLGWSPAPNSEVGGHSSEGKGARGRTPLNWGETIEGMVRHSETAEQIDRTVTEIDSVANALMPPSSLSSLLTSSTEPELVDISWKLPGVPASVAATLRGAKPTKLRLSLYPQYCPRRAYSYKTTQGLR